MLCRIQTSQTPDACTIHVVGRLAGAEVGELLNVCAEASGHLRIDLADLLSTDPAAVEALRRLAADGAELIGIAQYLRYRLGPF
jgi:enhancing lycopene biosynthesis protein 2